MIKKATVMAEMTLMGKIVGTNIPWIV